MRRSLSLVGLICTVYLLNSCGGMNGIGGNSTNSGGGVNPPPPGPATHFSVSTPTSVTSGSSFNLSVTALDASNNVATSYSGVVHFTSSDGQAVLPPDSTLASGTGMLPATLQTVGSQTITATDMGQKTITGVTSPIIVLPAAAASFTVSTPFSATAGTAFTFNVIALDSLGAAFPGYTGTVSFTSSDGQAVLPANSTLTNGKGTFSGTLKTVGNQTITATDTASASVTGTSSPIHVLAAASGFTPTGSMLHTRESHTATILNDGTVLVAGGMHWALAVGGCPIFGRNCLTLTALDSAEIYDPAAGTFQATGGMSARRVFHTATALADGRVLITGGDDRYGTTYSTAEIFDPATDTFTPTGNMVMPRSAHTATLLNNGKVLLAGGDGANGTVPSTAELFDPATGEFSPTGNMTVARFFQTATLLSDGRVLLAGGDTSGATATAELYDPLTGKFTATGSMAVTRTGHRATLLNNGKVLMTGGTSPGGTVTAELFDSATGTFMSTGSMVTERELHTATLLSNGKVLLTGGIDPNGINLATAELYDPANGTFSAAGNMETERTEHAATLLLTGEVLITGGINTDSIQQLNSLGSAELYP